MPTDTEALVAPVTDAEASAEVNLVETLADEFLHRHRAGDRPTLEEYVGRYPDVAVEIRAVFPALIAIERLKPGAADCSAAEDAETPLPERVGDYRVLREIGRGGMAVVYEAEQVSLGRRVALKVLPLKAAGDPKHLARFRRESRAAARLHHTNIVPIFEVGQDGEYFYYAMQFIAGQALDEILQEVQRLRADGGSRTAAVAAPGPVAQSLLSGDFAPTPRPDPTADYDPAADTADARPVAAERAALLPSTPSELSAVQTDFRLYGRNVARIGLQAAEALAYAHARGVIHRDVKPSNLLLDAAGVVWVSDFGLAKTQDHSLTETGDVVGTVRYMAPERFRGACDARSDVYALGLTLYELLTLRPAFDTSDRLRLIDQIAHLDPPRPRSVEPRIPRDLETVVMTAIDKDPCRRYQSAAALTADLRRFLADEPVAARRTGPAERVWRWGRRNPASAAAGILALVAATAVVALSVGSAYAVQLSREQDRTQVALQRAEVQQGVAEQKGAEAEKQRQRAEDQEKLARHYLYGANILLAQRAMDSNHVDLAFDYLERHLPEQGKDDVRGFEWHYLWRLSHAELLTFTVTERQLKLDYSEDGKRLISQNGPPRIWDAATGAVISLPEGITAAIERNVFSPDGRKLATSTRQEEIKLWDVTTGRELLTFKGPVTTQPNPTNSNFRFSPDGKRFAQLTQYPQVITVWDSTTGKELLSIKHTLRQGYAWDVRFSPDGKRLAAGSVGALKVWDAATGQEVRSFEGKFGPTTWLSFSPDGNRLAAGNQDSAARVWDLTTGQELFTLKGHTSAVWSVSFSPDGKRLATGSKDATVKVWDLNTGTEIATFRGHRDGVWGVAYSPDGTRIASGSSDKTVKIWDTSRQGEGRTIKTPASFINTIAFSPDGKQLASASGDLVWEEGKQETIKKAGADQVHLWNVATGQRTMSLKSPSGFGGSVAFSPDGKQLVTDSLDSTIRFWDAGTGQEVRSFKGDSGKVGNLAFSPDGKMVVFGTGIENGFKLFDAATGKELLASKDGLNMAGGIKFSPDGKRLAASKYGDVNVLDTADGKVLHRLHGHTAYCIGVAFTPDGKRLASGSWDNTAKLWDASTGRELLTLKGHNGYVTFVTFSPDGKRLATMSPAPQDKTIKIWDTSTGQELLTLKGHMGMPVFSPDGKLLASSGRDGTIQIWDATPVPEKP